MVGSVLDQIDRKLITAYMKVLKQFVLQFHILVQPCKSSWTIIKRLWF